MVLANRVIRPSDRRFVTPHPTPPKFARHPTSPHSRPALVAWLCLSRSASTKDRREQQQNDQNQKFVEHGEFIAEQTPARRSVWLRCWKSWVVLPRDVIVSQTALPNRPKIARSAEKGKTQLTKCKKKTGLLSAKNGLGKRLGKRDPPWDWAKQK